MKFAVTVTLKKDVLDPQGKVVGQTLKKDVLDPQGKVVENTLKNMGMVDLKSIRQGKHFEIEVNENNSTEAEKKVNNMCKKLLVNLIIEDYKISKI